jgi:prepilin signal peptidase PulO-like enzyme (type II secretory pathway)
MATAVTLVWLGLGAVVGLVTGEVSYRLAHTGRGLLRPDLLSVGLAIVDGLVLALWVRDQTNLPAIGIRVAVLMLLSLVLASDVRERAVYPVIVYPSIICIALTAPLLGISRMDAVSGAVITGIVFGLPYAAGRLRYGTGALGAGDVSVAVLVGTIVGLPRLPIALLLVGIIGAGLALLAGIRARSTRATFAYAPALSLAALTTMLLHM